MEADLTSVRAALKDVISAVDRYTDASSKLASDNGTASTGATAAARSALISDVHNLMRIIKGPEDAVNGHIENTTNMVAVRTLFGMGFFHTLPSDGTSMTAAALAEKLNVDKDLLVRLMWNATAPGPFAEVGEQEYRHTPYSLVYLNPKVAGLFTLAVDEILPGQLKLYEFLRSSGWKDPSSQTDNPYTYGHQTGGISMYEWISRHPERLRAFNFGMAAQAMGSNWTTGIFPWKVTLAALNPNDDTVLLVDIGGGKGQATRQIRELCSSVKGRMILQDRPDAIAQVDEELAGVEKMSYDFFTPQPIKGALIYFIRRCLHNWSDEKCVEILSNVAHAMSPGQSRLVLHEMVIPTINVDVDSAVMDGLMMVMGSKQRTEVQWQHLLKASGLVLKKIHAVPGTSFGAIEAVLP